MRRLAAVGIDMDDVGLTLEDQGVAGFHDSFQEVLAALDGQGPPTRPSLRWTGPAGRCSGWSPPPALTAVMIAAQLAGLTRLDLPLVLGTIVTEDPDRARVAGFVIHLAVGQVFALGYAAGVRALDRATWWLGGAARPAARRRRAHGARPAAPGRPSAHGVAPGRPGSARPCWSRPACSPSTTASRPRSVAIVAHLVYGAVARSAPAGALTCDRRSRDRPSAVADRRLRADRRHPHRRARVSRRLDRLAVRAPLRRPSRCSAGSSAGATAGTFRVGPGRAARPSSRALPAGHRHPETTWTSDGGRLTLDRGMVAEVAGRFLPATLLVRRLTAEGGPGRRRRRLRPPLRRATPRPRGPARRGDVRRVRHGAPLAVVAHLATPTRHRARAARHSITVAPGRPVTIVLAVAHREPLIHVDPTAAWDCARATKPRWRAWAAGIDADLPVPRRRRAQPADAAAAHLLAVGRAGRRAHHVAARGPRRRSATGTTATPGHATPASASPPSSAPARPTRPARFLAWLLHASRLDRPRLPVLFTLRRPPRTAANASSTAGPATPTAARSGSATAPPTSTSSTATAGCSTPPGSSSEPATASTRETWRAVRGFADLVAAAGANPTPGSGRSAATPPTTCTPSSWPGWRSTGPCASPTPTATPRPTAADAGRRARDAIADDVARPRVRRRPAHLHPQPTAPTDLDAALLVLPLLGIEPTRLAARARHHRRHPRRARRRRPAAVPLPARTRRPRRAPKARSCPARSGSSRPSPAPAAPPKPIAAVRRRSSRSRARSASTARRWTPPPAPTSATTRRR